MPARRHVPLLVLTIAVIAVGGASIRSLGCGGLERPPATPSAGSAVTTAPTPPPCQRPSHALAPHDYDQCAEITAAPRLTRWRPLVWRVVDRDPEAFALVMTFLFVESDGRQFAVSRSGCAGLLQFCDATAVRAPFDRIFDLQRLGSCRCADRRCTVDAPVRRLLETAGHELHPLVEPEFPCSLADARFDPEQAIRAGWTYIGRLAATFGSNVYLIYIGYNAGPRVAERIRRRLGPRRAQRLPAIGRVLRRALAPSFGRRARERARALLAIHLPKVASAYRTFRSSIGPTPGDRP